MTMEQREENREQNFGAKLRISFQGHSLDCPGRKFLLNLSALDKLLQNYYREAGKWKIREGFQRKFSCEDTSESRDCN